MCRLMTLVGPAPRLVVVGGGDASSLFVEKTTAITFQIVRQRDPHVFPCQTLFLRTLSQYQTQRPGPLCFLIQLMSSPPVWSLFLYRPSHSVF
jgi:hypothetical protein